MLLGALLQFTIDSRATSVYIYMDGLQIDNALLIYNRDTYVFLWICYSLISMETYFVCLWPSVSLQICNRVNNVISSVPQGTVLGPILFLILIGDIHENTNSHVSSFADDIRVLLSITDEDDVKTK